MHFLWKDDVVVTVMVNERENENILMGKVSETHLSFDSFEKHVDQD